MTHRDKSESGSMNPTIRAAYQRGYLRGCKDATTAERERCVALVHKHAEALRGYSPREAREALIAEIERGK